MVERIEPQWIFHLAAHGAYSWQTDWKEILKTNVQATLNLMEACASVGFEAFINAGSSSEYGFKDHAPDEEEFVEPNSHYAATKAAATQYGRMIAKMKNLPIRTLRLYSVYGPYESPERLFPNLIVKGLHGKLPPLAHPAVARDYVYTEDVDDAFLAAATVANQDPGAVYNVGTGVQTTLGDLVALSRTILGVMEEPRFGSMPNRSWDTTVWVANNERIKRQLGWSPKYTLEAGITAMAGWFGKNEKMLQRYVKQQSVAGSSADVRGR
jgi:dolichol-phosphate mannosyltransferase